MAMPRSLIFAVFVVACFFQAKFASAQSPQFLETYREVVRLKNAGSYTNAVPLAQRLLILGKHDFGADHTNQAVILNILGNLYRALGRYREAEPVFRQALDIQRRSAPTGHPDQIATLNNLAELLIETARYSDAQKLLIRARQIAEQSPGRPDRRLSDTLEVLGKLHITLDRFAKAEPLLKRVVDIREKAFGKRHPKFADALHSLAYLYQWQGRYPAAMSLFARALAIRRKALPPNHRDIAISLNSIASLQIGTEEYAKAKVSFSRAITIFEETFGSNHPSVAKALANLAGVYTLEREYQSAEITYQRALRIWESIPGPPLPDLAPTLDQLANVKSLQRRFDEAVPLRLRSLAIREKMFGRFDPDVAVSLLNLASDKAAQGKVGQALELARRASEIHRARLLRMGTARSAASSSSRRNARNVFIRHLVFADAYRRTMREPDGIESDALISETFEAGQLAQNFVTAGAISRMAARFVPADPILVQIVRDRQDTFERWQKIDGELFGGRRQSDTEAQGRLRAELTAVESRLDGLDQVIKERFQKYAELVSGRPVELRQLQTYLGPDEAVMGFLVAKTRTFIWVVRRDRADFLVAPVGEAALTEMIVSLRSALDPAVPIESISDLPAYDRFVAHSIYRQLFAPAEEMLQGIKIVFVVPDGPLQSIPFGMLVTDRPTERSPSRISDYRDTAWLERKFAFATLPSVSALVSLRRYAQGSKATHSFVGFGDPRFSVVSGQGRRRGSAGILRARVRVSDLAAIFRGGSIADQSELRRMPSLPDTADELRMFAQALGADVGTVYLGRRATETRVRSMDLSKFRILAFATHGLVAGDIMGLGEPGLVLTPPKKATVKDDGVLTASEVALLRLDADMVILSACNTAAPDGSLNAEGLTGLAKAFFYAGSRALLVSHWPVETTSASSLTTDLFRRLAANPELGHAEALRRTKIALIDGPGHLDPKTGESLFSYAHPLFWAPFVVVGEGRRVLDR